MPRQTDISSFLDEDENNNKGVETAKSKDNSSKGLKFYESIYSSIVGEERLTNRFPKGYDIPPLDITGRCIKFKLFKDTDEFVRKRLEYKKKYLSKNSGYRIIDLAELADKSCLRCRNLIRNIQSSLSRYLYPNQRTKSHDLLKEECFKLAGLLWALYVKRVRKYYVEKNT